MDEAVRFEELMKSILHFCESGGSLEYRLMMLWISLRDLDRIRI